MQKNKDFFPDPSGITEMAEMIKDLLVKANVKTATANQVKKALIGFFVDNCGAFGLVAEERILLQIEGINDAFGVSPKVAYKQVLDMVQREREEREVLFITSANGEALKKAFNSAF